MDSYTEVLKNSKSSHFLDEAPITENRQVKEKVIHHKDQVIESDQVTDNFEEPFEE